LGGANGWVHLVGTYDGTSWRLFRNGEQIASGADTSGALPFPGANWAVGSAGAGWEDYYAGAVDEVAIYETALTLAQVQAHYASGQSGGGVRLVIEKSGGGYVIRYANGTLQQSPLLQGQFTDVPNASSPYTIPPATAIMYYRLRL
jgi:hypothetical protein